MHARPLAFSLFISSLALLAPPALAQDVTPAPTGDVAAVAALGPVPAGRLGDRVVPQSYQLDLYLDPALEGFTGSARIVARLAEPTNYIDLHALGLTMRSAGAIMGGKSYAGQWTQMDQSGTGRLVFAEQLPAGDLLLDFTYAGRYNQGPAGLFRVKVGEDWFAWSQFQSIDARQAFPSFDEPGFKTPFSVTLRTRPGQVAVSNAPEVETMREGDWDVHRFAQTKPLPTYLAAMMVGPFSVIDGVVPPSPQRAGPLAQRVVTTPQNAAGAGLALDSAPVILRELEAYFDRPFPFEKLDQISTPILPGAMENAGAVLYGDPYLILGEGAGTADLRLFGMIMSHELAHQWFGDLVTPAWWDDIWLNESFANWMGYYIADRWRPELKVWAGALGDGFAAMNTDALLVGRPIRQEIATNDQIDGAFDTITYGKGGHVIAMIAAYLGEARFRDGVRAHVDKHAYGNATGEDFFAALAGAGGDPRIVGAMKGFVEQQGVPVLTIGGSGGHYEVSQSRYTVLGTDAPATRWVVPVCMRSDAARACKLLDGDNMAFELAGAGPLLPNAGGTGYYRFELAPAAWDALIAQGSQLTGGEAQAVGDSLRASFRAGRASAAQLIALASEFSETSDSYAFEEAGDLLAVLNPVNLANEAAQEAYRRLNQRLFAPRLAALGFDPVRGAQAGQDPEATQRREQIVARLAFVARDEPVRARLLAAAESYLGGDAAALDDIYLADALGVYIEDGDLARVQDLAARAVASQDPVFRPTALGALTRKGDPAIAAWLLDGFTDPGLRPTERIRLISGVIRTSQTRDMGVDWLRSHLAGMVEGSGGIFMMRNIPPVLAGFCSPERAEEFARDFAPLFAGTSGELSLARTLERIRNCAVLTEARGEEIGTALVDAAR